MSKFKAGDIVKTNHSDYPVKPLKILDVVYKDDLYYFSSDEGYAYLTESIGWDQDVYDLRSNHIWIEKFLLPLLSIPKYFDER